MSASVTTMADPTWLDALSDLGIGSLLGAAVGFVGSGLTQRGSDRRAAEREREVRREDREHRKEDQRRAFEISTFEQLPSLVQRCARRTTQLLLFDIQTLKEEGAIKDDSPHGGEEGLQDRLALRIVADQVLDDDVRASLVELQNELWAMETGPRAVEGREPKDLMIERANQIARLTHLVGEASETLNSYRRRLYKEA